MQLLATYVAIGDKEVLFEDWATISVPALACSGSGVVPPLFNVTVQGCCPFCDPGGEAPGREEGRDFYRLRESVRTCLDLGT